MNVYDFDNTIYDGESTKDFFLFLLEKNKDLTKYLPLVGYIALLHKTGNLPIEKIDLYLQKAEKLTNIIIKNKDLAQPLIKEFWEKHQHKLKEKFLAHLTKNDVIITASPQILLDAIKDKLPVKMIIGSKIDLDTGRIEFACIGKNKALAFRNMFGDAKIHNFYTDSLNDQPLIDISERAFLVKGNKWRLIEKKERTSRIK